MVYKNKYTEYLIAFSAIFFIGLIISAPAVCASGAKKGLSLCGDVLIPALFPFAVPVLFFINTSFFKKLRYKLSAVFILSLIGGYPIGAKLITELYRMKEINEYTAKKMLCICINAGPAFIVIAVGKSILGSIKLGFLLLLAHITASLILAIIFIPEIFAIKSKPTDSKRISGVDNFVLSVNGASGACITICAFVIIFSVINEYISYLSLYLKPLTFLLYIFEVTSAVSLTKNIYLISFLLGFAGISIWMQILSLCVNIKPKISFFISARVLHGIASSLITIITIKAFKISMPAISNNIITCRKVSYSGFSLSLSLMIMAIVLLINLFSKKHSGNIIRDML